MHSACIGEHPRQARPALPQCSHHSWSGVQLRERTTGCKSGQPMPRDAGLYMPRQQIAQLPTSRMESLVPACKHDWHNAILVKASQQAAGATECAAQPLQAWPAGRHHVHPSKACVHIGTHPAPHARKRGHENQQTTPSHVHGVKGRSRREVQRQAQRLLEPWSRRRFQAIHARRVCSRWHGSCRPVLVCTLNVCAHIPPATPVICACT